MPKAETEGHLAFSWDIQIIKELSVLRGAFLCLALWQAKL